MERIFPGRQRVDPRAPHQFRGPDRLARAGLRALIGSNAGPDPYPTDHYVIGIDADADSDRCQIEGCGKPSDDPIHEV